MVLIQCTLQPPACARLHDALVALAKVGEYVSLEAKSSHLTLTALNSSKSAYLSVKFDSTRFFHAYHFQSDRRSRDERFTCRLLNRALLSVFKARMVDSKGGSSNFERAEISLKDQPDRTQCRLIVKLFNRHGVTKTYRMTYEATDMMHALFNRDAATNRYKISSSLLRDYTDFFGPKTEQLNMCRDDQRMIFTSYTDKIVYGKEILKQPLQTSIMVDVKEFDEFDIEEQLHVGISVKDFRNLVTHADTLRTVVTAMYSQPGRPLQFSYAGEGIQTDFTLMTMGESRSLDAAKAVGPTTRLTAARHDSYGTRSGDKSMPPPPPRRGSSFGRSELGRNRTEQTSALHPREGSPLFVQQDDGHDDRQWDPADDQDDGAAVDVLGWDASGQNEKSFHGSAFRDTSRPFQPPPHTGSMLEDADVVAPTQRASQIKGLFD